MFREMTKIKQQLSKEETEAILERATCGVLGLIGDNGYPYTVPMSHVYDNGYLYLHSIKKGHKMDAIKANPNVSFTVIDLNEVASAEFTAHFRSAILFGKAEIVEDEAGRAEAFMIITKKLCADQSEEAMRKMYQSSGAGASVIKVKVEHMTGKHSSNFME